MNHSVISLFPVPLYMSTVDIDSFDMTSVIKNIEFKDMPIGGGQISISKQILNLDTFKEIKKQITDNLNNFTKNYLHTIDCEFYIKSSWIIKLSKGNYSNVHTHGNSLISGVLYLQSDKSSSLLHFSKDAKYNNLFPGTIVPNYKNYNNFNSDSYTATTEAGTLYLFPSNLSHSVPEHNSNQTRYSLSFDCFAKGKFGNYEENQLIL